MPFGRPRGVPTSGDDPVQKGDDGGQIVNE